MYKALYRKYRPQFFSDVVGQKVIVKTLQNSILNGKIGHAYMFFGPRGTGKTTLSKIFARTVNCLNSTSGEACGKCNNCLNSFKNECVDIIEMDAASNNGVDEIRELRSKISLVPAELKYKVYIIDEVHMLSSGAFNALLKTLEEPPEHAIFILATTDPHKVPETIVSRCQCFSFKRISENDIVGNLKVICDREKIEIDEDVLKEIALSSNGGMRDSIGMLDKISSYTSDKITYDKYIDINELLTKKDIENFVKSIFNKDIEVVLNIISQINSGGKNLIQVMSQILYFLRDEIVKFYKDNKCIFDNNELIYGEKLLNLINEKMFDIRKSENPRIYIEILFLKFMNDNIENHVEKDLSDDNIKEKNISREIIDKNIKNISREINKDLKGTKKVIKNTSNKPKILNIDEIIKVRVNNALARANKKVLQEEINYLNLLNDYTFDQEIGYLVCEILNSKFRVASDEVIVISYEYDSIVDQNLMNLDLMEDVYNKITNSNKSFAIISDSEWDKTRTDYIEKIKSGKHFELKEEPERLFEKTEKDDIISSDTINLFGDIVEIE